MSVKEVTVEPVTRIEGHSAITILLEKKKVKEARFNVIESPRFFEKLLEGKFAEEAPRITERLCGVCPVAHHLASVKAVEAAWGCLPPQTSINLRRLMLIGQLINSHSLHLGFLALPDLLDLKDRSILGISDKDPKLVSSLFKLNRFGLQLTEAVGGRAVHPVAAIPGGMSKPLEGKSRDELLEIGKECRAIAYDLAKLIEEVVRKSDNLVRSLDLNKTRYVALTGDGRFEMYDGRVGVSDPSGKKYEFEPKDYSDHIAEKLTSHSYVKYPYLKKFGYPAGTYRVGPLARLNITEIPATDELADYIRTFSNRFGTPAHNAFAYTYARAIELIYAIETALDKLGDPAIEKEDVFAAPEPKEGHGVGIVEAPRGTLIHDYHTDNAGLITKANIISPTTHNAPCIEADVFLLASNIFSHERESEQGMLSRAEVLVRAYDPCLTCATHLVDLKRSA
jgi:F420-non-reducing hydrogenase large subunit